MRWVRYILVELLKSDQREGVLLTVFRREPFSRKFLGFESGQYSRTYRIDKNKWEVVGGAAN